MAEPAAIESMCGMPKSIKRNLDRYALDKEYSMSPPTADDNFFAIQVPWRQHRSKHYAEEQAPTITARKETKGRTLASSVSEGCLAKSPSIENLNSAVNQIFCKDNRTSLPNTPFSTPPSTPHGTPQSSPMIQRREFKHKDDPSKHPFKRFYFPGFQQAARLHSVSETEGSEKNDLNIVTEDGLQAQRLRHAPTGSLLGDPCFSKESSPELPLSPGSQESANLADSVVGRPRLGSGGSITRRGYFYMGMGNLNNSVKELVEKKLDLIKPDNNAVTQTMTAVKPPTPPKPIKEPVFEPPKRPPRMIPKNSKLRELNMFAPGAGF